MFKTQVELTSGLTAKFWTFCGLISMVYKSVDRGKLWSICFLQQHLLVVSCEVSRKITRDMLRHFHGLYSQRPYFLTNQRARIPSVIVKFESDEGLFWKSTFQGVILSRVTLTYVPCNRTSNHFGGTLMLSSTEGHFPELVEFLTVLLGYWNLRVPCVVRQQQSTKLSSRCSKMTPSIIMPWRLTKIICRQKILL